MQLTKWCRRSRPPLHLVQNGPYVRNHFAFGDSDDRPPAAGLFVSVLSGICCFGFVAGLLLLGPKLSSASASAFSVKAEDVCWHVVRGTRAVFK